MPKFELTITLNTKIRSLEKIEALFEAIAKKHKLDLYVRETVKPPKSPESRADRLAAAQGMVDDARGEVESLKDELEGWKDGLPENLQNGSKADELQEAIDALESLVSNLDSVEGFDDVNFPGMY